MLELAIERQDSVAIVRCKGRILFGPDVEKLEEQVRTLLAEISSVVMNLADVNYVDSAGQGALVHLCTTARNAGGNLVLSDVQKRVYDLLAISMLVKVIPVFPTEAEALASFKSASKA